MKPPKSTPTQRAAANVATARAGVVELLRLFDLAEQDLQRLDFPSAVSKAHAARELAAASIRCLDQAAADLQSEES